MKDFEYTVASSHLPVEGEREREREKEAMLHDDGLVHSARAHTHAHTGTLIHSTSDIRYIMKNVLMVSKKDRGLSQLQSKGIRVLLT